MQTAASENLLGTGLVLFLTYSSLTKMYNYKGLHLLYISSFRIFRHGLGNFLGGCILCCSPSQNWAALLGKYLWQTAIDAINPLEKPALPTESA